MPLPVVGAAHHLPAPPPVVELLSLVLGAAQALLASPPRAEVPPPVLRLPEGVLVPLMHLRWSSEQPAVLAEQKNGGAPQKAMRTPPSRPYLLKTLSPLEHLWTSLLHTFFLMTFSRLWIVTQTMAERLVLRMEPVAERMKLPQKALDLTASLSFALRRICTPTYFYVARNLSHTSNTT